jgi:uncharacterized protein YraI
MKQSGWLCDCGSVMGLRRGLALSLIAILLTALLAIVFPHGMSSLASASSKFDIGDSVHTTANLNVRTGAGVSYPELSDPDYPGYALEGTTGVILDGPESADGYIWWKVEYDAGYTGWSAQDWLETTSTPTPSLPSPPTPASPGSSSEPSPLIDTLTPTLRWNGVSGADYYALAISRYPYGSSNIIYNPQVVYGTSLTVPNGYWSMGRNTAGICRLTTVQAGVQFLIRYIFKHFQHQAQRPLQRRHPVRHQLILRLQHHCLYPLPHLLQVLRRAQHQLQVRLQAPHQVHHLLPLQLQRS